MNIQNINRLNNEYRAYIYEAESHRITRAGVASREEGLSYQRAAQICGQLASMTTGRVSFARQAWPWASKVAAPAATAWRSVLSSASAWLPGCWATNDCSASALRADTTTCAPRACSAAAVARPMPLEAPTSQTRWPGQWVMRGFNAMGCVPVQRWQAVRAVSAW